MGGTSKSTSTTNQTQQTNPYEPAQPQLDSLIGQLGQINPALTDMETGALNTLSANAQAGNPYAPAIGGLATDLLSGGTDRTGMVNDAYSAYTSSLNPIARGDFVNPESNPQLQGYLSTIQDDVAKRVNGMFAGAGRDLSGANLNALGRGIAAGTAPVLYDAYNQARGQQLGAMDKLYGAGGTTSGLLSALDQQNFANRQAGVGVAQSALAANDAGAQRLLDIEAMKRNIPQGNIASLLSTLGPIAAQFGETQGQSTTNASQTMSPIQQIATLMTAWGNMTGANRQQGAQPFAW
jgi:hypothetical protein